MEGTQEVVSGAFSSSLSPIVNEYLSTYMDPRHKINNFKRLINISQYFDEDYEKNDDKYNYMLLVQRNFQDVIERQNVECFIFIHSLITSKVLCGTTVFNHLQLFMAQINFEPKNKGTVIDTFFKEKGFKYEKKLLNILLYMTFIINQYPEETTVFSTQILELIIYVNKKQINRDKLLIYLLYRVIEKITISSINLNNSLIMLCLKTSILHNNPTICFKIMCKSLSMYECKNCHLVLAACIRFALDTDLHTFKDLTTKKNLKKLLAKTIAMSLINTQTYNMQQQSMDNISIFKSHFLSFLNCIRYIWFRHILNQKTKEIPQILRQYSSKADVDHILTFLSLQTTSKFAHTAENQDNTYLHQVLGESIIYYLLTQNNIIFNDYTIIFIMEHLLFLANDIYQANCSKQSSTKSFEIQNIILVFSKIIKKIILYNEIDKINKITSYLCNLFRSTKSCSLDHYLAFCTDATEFVSKNLLSTKDNAVIPRERSFLETNLMLNILGCIIEKDDSLESINSLCGNVLLNPDFSALSFVSTATYTFELLSILLKMGNSFFITRLVTGYINFISASAAELVNLENNTNDFTLFKTTSTLLIGTGGLCYCSMYIGENDISSDISEGLNGVHTRLLNLYSNLGENSSCRSSMILMCACLITSYCISTNLFFLYNSFSTKKKNDYTDNFSFKYKILIEMLSKVLDYASEMLNEFPILTLYLVYSGFLLFLAILQQVPSPYFVADKVLSEIHADYLALLLTVNRHIDNLTSPMPDLFVRNSCLKFLSVKHVRLKLETMMLSSLSILKQLYNYIEDIRPVLKIAPQILGLNMTVLTAETQFNGLILLDECNYIMSKCVYIINYNLFNENNENQYELSFSTNKNIFSNIEKYINLYSIGNELKKTVMIYPEDVIAFISQRTTIKHKVQAILLHAISSIDYMPNIFQIVTNIDEKLMCLTVLRNALKRFSCLGGEGILIVLSVRNCALALSIRCNDENMKEKDFLSICKELFKFYEVPTTVQNSRLVKCYAELGSVLVLLATKIKKNYKNIKVQDTISNDMNQLANNFFNDVTSDLQNSFKDYSKNSTRVNFYIFLITNFVICEINLCNDKNLSKTSINLIYYLKYFLKINNINLRRLALESFGIIKQGMVLKSLKLEETTIGFFENSIISEELINQPLFFHSSLLVLGAMLDEEQVKAEEIRYVASISDYLLNLMNFLLPGPKRIIVLFLQNIQKLMILSFSTLQNKSLFNNNSYDELSFSFSTSQISRLINFALNILFIYPSKNIYTAVLGVLKACEWPWCINSRRAFWILLHMAATKGAQVSCTAQLFIFSAVCEIGEDLEHFFEIANKCFKRGISSFEPITKECIKCSKINKACFHNSLRIHHQSTYKPKVNRIILLEFLQVLILKKLIPINKANVERILHVLSSSISDPGHDRENTQKILCFGLLIQHGIKEIAKAPNQYHSLTLRFIRAGLHAEQRINSGCLITLCRCIKLLSIHSSQAESQSESFLTVLLSESCLCRRLGFLYIEPDNIHESCIPVEADELAKIRVFFEIFDCVECLTTLHQNILRQKHIFSLVYSLCISYFYDVTTLIEKDAQININKKLPCEVTRNFAYLQTPLVKYYLHGNNKDKIHTCMVTRLLSSMKILTLLTDVICETDILDIYEGLLVFPSYLRQELFTRRFIQTQLTALPLILASSSYMSINKQVFQFLISILTLSVRSGRSLKKNSTISNPFSLLRNQPLLGDLTKLLSRNRSEFFPLSYGLLRMLLNLKKNAKNEIFKKALTNFRPLLNEFVNTIYTVVIREEHVECLDAMLELNKAANFELIDLSNIYEKLFSPNLQNLNENVDIKIEKLFKIILRHFLEFEKKGGNEKYIENICSSFLKKISEILQESYFTKFYSTLSLFERCLSEINSDEIRESKSISSFFLFIFKLVYMDEIKLINHENVMKNYKQRAELFDFLEKNISKIFQIILKLRIPYNEKQFFWITIKNRLKAGLPLLYSAFHPQEHLYEEEQKVFIGKLTKIQYLICMEMLKFLCKQEFNSISENETYKCQKNFFKNIINYVLRSLYLLDESKNEIDPQENIKANAVLVSSMDENIQPTFIYLSGEINRPLLKQELDVLTFHERKKMKTLLKYYIFEVLPKQSEKT